MKWNFFILLVCFQVGCGGTPQPTSHFAIDPHAAIVGGKETTEDNVIAKYVVLIYDTPSKSYCTGSLISKNVILTAAHCVDKSSEVLTLAFGLQPLKGNYILRQSRKVILHPQYKKSNINDPHDLALIGIQGFAPIGFQALLLPEENFPLISGISFTASGYGRISGKKDLPENSQGAGKLRHVELKIDSLSSDEMHFFIDQKSRRGICHGDSGGPALMRYLGKDYVVGVASAISWSTLPSSQTDVCAEKSIYMNVKKFRPWIQESLRYLTDEFSKTASKNQRVIK